MNSTERTTKAVARFGKVWQLLESEDFDIRSICNLPFMSGDIVKSDGYIVVGISGGSLIIFIIDDYLKKGELVVRDLPSDLIVHSLVIGSINDRRIYIGGETKIDEEGEEFQSMYYIDLSDYDLIYSECRIEPFPLPEELKRPGKAIDDIGLYGNNVYVLDNIILPKFLYIFSVKNLELKEVVSLHANGTYENYYRIAINSQYIVMLSSSVGEGGVLQHMSFYSRANAKFISAISFPVYRPGDPTLMNDLFPRFNDLLLVKDNLIIAADAAGVVKLDLSSDEVKDVFELVEKDNDDNVDDIEIDIDEWIQVSKKTKEHEDYKKDIFSRPFIGNAISVQPLYGASDNLAYRTSDNLKSILVTVLDRGVFRTEVKYIKDGELI